MAPRPLADLGAGLTTKAPSIDPHPAGPPQHGTPGQIERAFTAASTFFSGLLAISASQLLGAPLKAIDPKFYDAYMAFTKQSFGVLVTTMTQWFSPTVIRVSGDKSLPGQLVRREDGSLECRFPKRLVLMANHQLYSDWLYLWYISYTNNMHGYIYIILKESLKNVPLVGWGAQFYNFIFLSRNWEKDKKQFTEHLDQLNKPDDPMWLLIFPEGTNLASGTREKSKAWAQKMGLQDMKHQLLPRSRGLQLTLQRLGNKNTEYLYDCTIAYEGIPHGQFGQDIFTLRSSMFEGRPPKSVNMYFRRFKISDIPVQDDQKFEIWLRNRWREKDYLLEHYNRFNCFPDDVNWMLNQTRQGTKQLKEQPAKHIETQIKSNNAEEFLSIFAPITSVGVLMALANGGVNTTNLTQMLGKTGDVGADQLKAITAHFSKQQRPLNGMASLKEIDKLIPAVAQKEMMQRYLGSVRPAVVQEIELPEDALRAKNLPKSTGKSLSTTSQTDKTKPASNRQPAGVAATRAQSSPAIKTELRDASVVGQSRSVTSRARTIRPESSVSKMPALPALQTKLAGRSMGASTIANHKSAVAPPPQTQSKKAIASTATKRKVNISPAMLARMRAGTTVVAPR